MATRRIEGEHVDHGAQYFTVKDNIFAGWVEAWENEGIIKEWFSRLAEESSELGHPRFCCRRGMTQLAKHLAEGVDVELEQKVTKIHYKGGHWFVHTESGNAFDADYLLLTSPAPQAVDLIKSSNIILRKQKLEALEAIEYDPCLTVLAVLDGPSGLRNQGGIKIHEAPLSWLGDNRMKGISGKSHIVTIHSDHAFAKAHFDDDAEAVTAVMVEAARKYLKSNIVKTVYHRWRYALPKSPFESAHFFSRRHSLVVAGDAFGGGRVESAALSGIEAAAHLVDLF